MVDLYYTLYGTRVPNCLPNPELASILKPQKLASSFAAVANRERTDSERERDQLAEIELESMSQKRQRSLSPLDVKPLDLIDIGPTELLIPPIRSREASPLGIGEEEIRDEIILETVDSNIKTEIVEMVDRQSDLKEEIVDLDDQNSITMVSTEPPPVKKSKTDFYSDNSISLPGITPSSSSVTGPTGFEPGMFGSSKSSETVVPTVASEPSVSSKSDGSKVRPEIHFRKNQTLPLTKSPPFQKKKKKDKKKHKHKHKHKHNKDKDRDREKDREKSKEKKDPSIVRLIKEDTQETLSSADSSSRDSNPTTLDLTL